MWGRQDSQEDGLEAAILERVLNSSLVECRRADNVPGLKPRTDAARSGVIRIGRGAFAGRGSGGGTRRGAQRSANAGMSSARKMRSLPTECPRVPTEGTSTSG